MRDILDIRATAASVAESAVDEHPNYWRAFGSFCCRLCLLLSYRMGSLGRTGPESRGPESWRHGRPEWGFSRWAFVWRYSRRMRMQLTCGPLLWVAWSHRFSCFTSLSDLGQGQSRRVAAGAEWLSSEEVEEEVFPSWVFALWAVGMALSLFVNTSIGVVVRMNRGDGFRGAVVRQGPGVAVLVGGWLCAVPAVWLVSADLWAMAVSLVWLSVAVGLILLKARPLPPG